MLNINGCGHTQTTITKIMDRIEKKKDLLEFELLKNFLYNSIRKNQKNNNQYK